EVSGDLPPALAQAREVIEAQLAIPLQSHEVAACIAAHGEVLVHGQVLENAAAFHHLEDPAAYDLLRIERLDALAVELDGAVGDFALLRPQQSGDGLQRRALAGAVGSEEGHDLPLGHHQL